MGSNAAATSGTMNAVVLGLSCVNIHLSCVKWDRHNMWRLHT